MGYINFFTTLTLAAICISGSVNCFQFKIQQSFFSSSSRSGSNDPAVQALPLSLEEASDQPSAYLRNVISGSSDPVAEALPLSLEEDFVRASAYTTNICEETDWRKASLKLLKEIPFAGVFRDLRGETKFEASGLDYVNGSYYVIFDSHHSVGVVESRFEFRAPANTLVGELGGDSDYEGITYRTDNHNFIIIQESHDHKASGVYKPRADEIRIENDNYTVVESCDIEFNLTHNNKGFESIMFHDGGDDAKYLLGLCEGNHCAGGKEGRDLGNGRMVISKYEKDDEGICRWVPVKTVNVPATAWFLDYADMGYRNGKLAIVSQEDSAVWIGDFSLKNFEFLNDGEVFHFPRNDHCDMVYCNVEGIAWLDDVRLVATSDRAKSTQPFVCTPRDQSMHIFMLPHGFEPST